MRGKPTAILSASISLRITPADAGKTLRVFGFKLLDEDHPRGCGENCLAKRTIRLFTGSPPQVRGKLHDASTVCR